MTYFELERMVQAYDPEDEVDFNELFADYERAYEERVEMLEERQEKSGMYAQQDMIALRYFER